MSDTLQPGQQLDKGQQLISENGVYTLDMQPDGNLVLYEQGVPEAIWATNTAHTDSTYAAMQADGNFVVYDPLGTSHFATHTEGHPGAWIVLQNDGDLVVYYYNPGPTKLWDSGT